MKNFQKTNQNTDSYSVVKLETLAQVVKLVDTRDLKSLEGNFVPVQVGPGHHNMKVKRLSLLQVPMDS